MEKKLIEYLAILLILLGVLSTIKTEFSLEIYINKITHEPYGTVVITTPKIKVPSRIDTDKIVRCSIEESVWSIRLIGENLDKTVNYRFNEKIDVLPRSTSNLNVRYWFFPKEAELVNMTLSVNVNCKLEGNKTTTIKVTTFKEVDLT